MDVKKTIKSLELRNFSVKYFESSAEAVSYLCDEIKNTSVGFGGSKTADQLGLYEKLGENNTVYWHWRNNEHETMLRANEAAVYITSANAITEDGQIVNIDGRGNRLAGMVFGRKRTFIIAGTNKICSDLDSAIRRARDTVAVENVKRFPFNVPCKIDGKCHDCRSPERACNALMVLWGPMMEMDMEIVLIDEELGL